MSRVEEPLKPVLSHIRLIPLNKPYESSTVPFASLNASKTPFSEALCIHHLFEAQANETPDAIAVRLDDSTLTYRALNRRANHLARHLQTLGVGPDVLVGLYVERSLEMIVGLLAILKAGGAYVPLDPTYPRERLLFLLEDAQPTLLIAQEHLRSRLPHYDGIVVSTEPYMAGTDEDADDKNASSAVTPENLVYVIYTSGSTGTPKGILTTHRSLVNYAEYACKRYGIRKSDRVLQFASINFDASAEEIYPSLISGATLVLRTGAWLDSVRTFLQHCEAAGITVLDLPTAYWHELTHALAAEHLLLPASIRTLLIGGERALPERLRLWRAHVGKHVRLFNTYGPTETTIVATVAELTEASEQESSSKDGDERRQVSIGHPIANTQVYVLDAERKPVRVGTVGELYIGGVGLARGYHRRPALTDERFILHSFDATSTVRLYRTGDLVRYLPGGELEFQGRADNQVKIRGFRVEPGEIETVLVRYPAIREAVVVVQEDSAGESDEKRLVACVVLHKDQQFTESDVRGYMMKHLPSYMLPSAYMVLDALPLTPAGKVDRRSLALLEYVPTAQHHSGEDFVAPTTLVQQQLQRLWEELLNVRPIGIRDNFFYLGGHSLLAARLVARIEQVLCVKITLAMLFAAPTIEQLALAMQAEEQKTVRSSAIPVQARGSQRPFFYLHGAWDSDAFYCFQLAQRLGPEQPFYALAPYDFSGLEDAPSVEEMATAHIRAIRLVQPEGPYRLGGFCNGGLMAYEMARQLIAEGEQVEHLVLIVPAYPSLLHAVVRGVINRIGAPLGWNREQQLEYFLRVRHLYKYLRGERRKGRLKAFRKIEPSIFTPVPTRNALLQDDNAILDWTVAGYSYPEYTGPIQLVWARGEWFHNIWRRKARQEDNIALHIVPGSHIGCRTEHIHSLAETLAYCLQESGNVSGGYEARGRSDTDTPIHRHMDIHEDRQPVLIQESKYGENISLAVD